MAIANVNGVEIYYETQGSGEPVLLVPPSWWPCATWNVVVVPMLARRYRTIIYDGRGTGRSGKPKDGYTVRQFAADGIELLEQLGVTRCHVVGFAIGGQIVQAMAIERPDLIASLTIAATGPGSRRLDGTPREVAPEALRGHREDRLREIHPHTYRQRPHGVQSRLLPRPSRSRREFGAGAVVGAKHGGALSYPRTSTA